MQHCLGNLAALAIRICYEGLILKRLQCLSNRFIYAEGWTSFLVSSPNMPLHLGCATRIETIWPHNKHLANLYMLRFLQAHWSRIYSAILRFACCMLEKNISPNAGLTVICHGRIRTEKQIHNMFHQWIARDLCLLLVFLLTLPYPSNNWETYI